MKIKLSEYKGLVKKLDQCQNIKDLSSYLDFLHDKYIGVRSVEGSKFFLYQINSDAVIQYYIYSKENNIYLYKNYGKSE